MVETSPDFSAFADTTIPSTGELAALSALARDLVQAEVAVAVAETRLLLAKARAAALGEVQIPAAMQALRLQKIKLDDGSELEVVLSQSARLSEGRRDDAMAWLVGAGDGGLIKTAVTAFFPKAQQAQAEELAKQLRAQGRDTAEKQWVEPGTLLKHLKELKTKGVPFPEETFGWHERKVTKVTRTQ